MKIIWSGQIDNILKVGHPLNEIGVNNWALNKEAALRALIQLEDLQVPVLGGDVCELINDIIQYNYDNWYCNQIQGESNSEFVSRSITKAIQYIENYPSQNTDKIFFVLVPKTLSC